MEVLKDKRKICSWSRNTTKKQFFYRERGEEIGRNCGVAGGRKKLATELEMEKIARVQSLKG